MKVLLDRNKYETVINNLLSNAFKFTEMGGRVRLRVEEDGTNLTTQVVDSGRGIHKDDLPFVFDRFYQSKRNRTNAEGGSGIGLALSFEFAKLCGGKLWAESTINQGSQFFFQFPLQEVIATVTDEEAVELQKLSDSVQASDSTFSPDQSVLSNIQSLEYRTTSEDLPMILIVEDNPDMRDYLQLILERSYNVIQAFNGKEALTMLSRQKT